MQTLTLLSAIVIPTIVIVGAGIAIKEMAPTALFLFRHFFTNQTN